MTPPKKSDHFRSSAISAAESAYPTGVGSDRLELANRILLSALRRPPSRKPSRDARSPAYSWLVRCRYRHAATPGRRRQTSARHSCPTSGRARIFLLRQIATEPAGQLFGVATKLLGRHRRRERWDRSTDTSCRAALIPMNDDEILFQGARVPPRQRQLRESQGRHAGSATRDCGGRGRGWKRTARCHRCERSRCARCLRRDDPTQVADDARCLRA